MHIAILGRQPALGTAELERVFGSKSVKPLSPESVSIDTDCFDIQHFGGVLKAGKIIMEISTGDWRRVSDNIVQHYAKEWSSFDGKITFGISAYNFNVDARAVQKTGIIIKQKMKKTGVSLRLVPNPEPALNTATSHHNKLGLSENKVEIILVRTYNDRTIVAESTGAQNITAYAKRDQERPKRDAFVGMLPPKLAQIMVNLAVGQLDKSLPLTVLDPFCGTGVVLQEALLMGYSAYGTDLSDKMIDYTRANLEWLSDKYHKDFHFNLHTGDATTTKWQPLIDVVASEAYLGQPFSAAPSPEKLEEVKNNCNRIISEFLKNLANQIKPGTQVCIAVPAWRNPSGKTTHLPLISTIAKLGYRPYEFAHVSKNDMLYYRENQIVARELLVLTRV
jgi:tRNA G10  N-methylase Trm11